MQWVSGVLGGLSLALGLQDSILPPAWRPYLIGVGVVLLLLAVVLVVEGPVRGRTTDIKANIKGNENKQYVAGRDVNIGQTPAEKEFANAPHLIWSSVRVVKSGQIYEVLVACHNAGPTAIARPDNTWVRSTVDVLGPPIPNTNPILARVTQQPEVMEFVGFDTQGPIHAGTFDLRMQCKDPSPIPGEREVRWRVTYMDDDMERGYITECSAKVIFVGLGSTRIDGLPALDGTSRKARNDDYNAYMEDKTPPSTGPSRPH